MTAIHTARISILSKFLIKPRSSRRWSSSDAPQPVIILLGGGDSSVWRPPLLLPHKINPQVNAASSVDEAIEKIHHHYSLESNFVGGMGESDPGVLLAASEGDILDISESAIKLMESVKAERHGVPFLLATTGIPSENGAVDWDTWSGKPMESWLVSLYAASPPAYKVETGGDASSAKAFGQVCEFLINANEQGIAVEATVTPPQAAAGRELALSLGARQVHVVETNH